MVKLARINCSFEVFEIISDKSAKEILFKVLEQIEMVGEDDSNAISSIGANVLETLKKEGLIFVDGILRFK